MKIRRVDTNEIGSRAVIHNNVVYLCGQVAHDFEGGIVDQMTQALSRIDEILKTVNSSKASLLNVTIYLKSNELFDDMNKIWVEWLKDVNTPARATVIADMVYPEILIELSVTAAIDK
ncbi:RidA family protein [Emcibacteraceae bacterium]|nr:RidA family protein [Emcibacteraceae bacterium]